ncbi:MAG: phosphoribosylglycinamide formyltransferase [Candidatus Methanoplasma sp.]|jgi:phosphoribosylglycinamide formyltransferase-1|nr:phosphoribosylglycinamide formyltransferase [Candidatus Methanoplasma sp.]
MIRLGWFSTGRGPGSRNLLRTVMEKKEQGLIDVEISFVFCNWNNLEEPNPRKQQREQFFELVKGYGIPLITASWKDFRPDLWSTDQGAWRTEYGKLLREKVGGYDFDLGILAGYMLWMDDDTCEKYDMINLHPALPEGPKGTWEEVIWSLIREKAVEQGAMLHICTKDWDRGDALTYCRFAIRGEGFDALWSDLEEKLRSSSLDDVIAKEGTDEPLFKKIREAGVERELPLIVSTIKLFSEGKIRIKGKKLMENGRKLENPYDITCEVESTLENNR